MATLTAVNPRWRYNQSGLDAMATERRLVDGDAVFKVGQPCYDKADGLMYTSVASSSANVYKYIALEDVSTAIGADTTYKRFARIRPSDVFEMNVYHTTAASAVVTEAMTGVEYGIKVNSNVAVVDIENTTQKSVQIVAPSWRDDSTNNSSDDVYARALVKFLVAVTDVAAA